MMDDKVLVQMRKLNRAVMTAFLLLALTLAFWGVLRAQSLAGREDNPRLVEAELRIQRGQILDRHDTVLASTRGPADELERYYPIPNIGPAVGYYSFRHGTAGIEESFDTWLRGDSDDFWAEFWRQSLHQPQQGQSIRLTLDSRLQQAIAPLSPGQGGAALLLGLPQMDILALASFPTYDPNELDERFEMLRQDDTAPLLNRVTQGQYQPGLLLQPLLLAYALDSGTIRLDDAVPDADVPVPVDGLSANCLAAPPQPATWADVLLSRCPGPMATLGRQLGAGQLTQIFADFGLSAPPNLPLDTETADLEPIADVGLAGIGQDNLLVTPLQIGLAWASLGEDGRLAAPRLIAAVQDREGEWQDPADGQSDLRQIISPSVATRLRQLLAGGDDLVEYALLVLSGPEGSTDAWYLALAPAVSPDFAVVVVVEDTAQLADAAVIGRSILDAALP